MNGSATVIADFYYVLIRTQTTGRGTPRSPGDSRKVEYVGTSENGCSVEHSVLNVFLTLARLDAKGAELDGIILVVFISV